MQTRSISYNKSQEELAFVVVVSQSQNFKLKQSRNCTEGIQQLEMPRARIMGGEVLNEMWFMRGRSQRATKNHGRWKVLSLWSQTSRQEIEILLQEKIDSRR